MEDLKDLYREIILDHSKSPRNFGKISPCTHEGHGDNPLCGDEVSLYLRLGEDETLADVGFEGKGCAISIASASMMTELVKGTSCADAKSRFQQFLTLFSDDSAQSHSDIDDRMKALIGVKQFPMRVKCATLPWHALNAALSGIKSKDDGETKDGC
ncbi:Fe-S cluster assembly sulfur transfer protein SufU [Sneathiella glossodoripedis]|uniref:Fe-S cluster assembly sulfur transfer protein SufU n=1 Tax=Sneathiella glossodoripedis TaxID=418853 RepID=UPI00046F498A|nr:SUF system NifU family Fe-S cluster assembly protein [Sneathiella glossodoripedis]